MACELTYSEQALAYTYSGIPAAATCHGDTPTPDLCISVTSNCVRRLRRPSSRPTRAINVDLEHASGQQSNSRDRRSAHVLALVESRAECVLGTGDAKRRHDDVRTGVVRVVTGFELSEYRCSTDIGSGGDSARPTAATSALSNHDLKTREVFVAPSRVVYRQPRGVVSSPAH